jgi:type IV secretory pathway component VirB8
MIRRIRRQRTQEADQKVDIVPGVLRTEAQQHYGLVLRNHRRKKLKEVSFKTVFGFLFVGLVVNTVRLQEVNSDLALKAASKDVVYVAFNPGDAVAISSKRFDYMPDEIKNDVPINTLWTYVTDRECFSSGNAATAWYRVQSMSDSRVAEEFKAWYDAKNPDSPQNVLGKKNIVQKCKLIDYASSGTDGGQSLTIRFSRFDDDGARRTPEIIYAVTMRYRLGIFNPDPSREWRDRSQFNQAGVQVWEYPGAHAAGTTLAAKDR